VRPGSRVLEVISRRYCRPWAEVADDQRARPFAEIVWTAEQRRQGRHRRGLRSSSSCCLFRVREDQDFDDVSGDRSQACRAPGAKVCCCAMPAKIRMVDAECGQVFRRMLGVEL